MPPKPFCGFFVPGYGIAVDCHINFIMLHAVGNCAPWFKCRLRCARFADMVAFVTNGAVGIDFVICHSSPQIVRRSQMEPPDLILVLGYDNLEQISVLRAVVLLQNVGSRMLSVGL